MKSRLFFILLAVGSIAAILLTRSEKTEAVASAFGKASVIVASVFVVMVTVIGIAWVIHKRKRDALFKDDVR
jgi:hypothetical protein